MSDLTLPVARLPGAVEVAREVLGGDPWRTIHNVIALPAWWREWMSPEEGVGYQCERIVPLSVPAGRLVAETWLDRVAPVEGLEGDLPWADMRALHRECLWVGDLLRLASALGVEVPAGTVPRLERAPTMHAVWCLWVDGGRVDFVAEWATDPEVLVPALAGITDPRAALDRIVAEVLRG